MAANDDDIQPQSLYRRYRPQFFREVVGQQHLTQALLNAVRENRVGHAYLFSGPRGTGKTSTARILAEALNCEQLCADGEPCGTCGNCEAIANSTFPDLIELDAASNNGVDAMRDLIDKVHYGVSAKGKLKVYVIDEVHMLSAGASNALLKTLEEPPKHVVFVLATTDSHRVLPTLRSRTQHFEVNLVSTEDLHALLTRVLEQEGVTAEQGVIDVIVRRAAGSARDAESILDQALAVGRRDDTLDTDAVLTAFGGTAFERRLTVLAAIAADDPAAALLGASEVLAHGVDPRELAEELLRTLRDAFVLAAGKGRVPYDGPVEEAQRLTEFAAGAGLSRLTRGIETLGDAIADMRGQGAPDPRLVLEVALVRLARPSTSTDAESLAERLDRLEARVHELGSTSPAAAPSPAAQPAAAQPATAPGSRPALGAFARATTAPAPPAEPVAPVVEQAPAAPRPIDFDDVVVAWKDTLAGLSRMTSSMVQQSQPIRVEGDTIVFGVPGDQLTAVSQRFRNNADEIRSELERHLGTRVRFKVVGHDFDAPGALRPPEGSQPHDAHEPEEIVDLDDLVDAPDAAAPLGTEEMFLSEFGAQVVEERPRGDER